jgi:hypothetical protein
MKSDWQLGNSSGQPSRVSQLLGESAARKTLDILRRDKGHHVQKGKEYDGRESGLHCRAAKRNISRRAFSTFQARLYLLLYNRRNLRSLICMIVSWEMTQTQEQNSTIELSEN